MSNEHSKRCLRALCISHVTVVTRTQKRGVAEAQESVVVSEARSILNKHVQRRALLVAIPL